VHAPSPFSHARTSSRRQPGLARSRRSAPLVRPESARRVVTSSRRVAARASAPPAQYKISHAARTDDEKREEEEDDGGGGGDHDAHGNTRRTRLKLKHIGGVK